ncbi:hypothetical protein CFC21_031182 [Triticum aestivum]|uniref:DUF6598 domain-containing protein n=2 Tax=Triticum aestivum TaxID=4565 RepID=A0A3B6DL84_WHEAT|nr:hypothetical protein CFC21_031182 [Triticum aestivum]
MELIDSGLALMEISMGESSTKTRMKSIREAEQTNLRRIRELQERIRRRQEQLVRDPQPPLRYEFEKAPTDEQEAEDYRQMREMCFRLNFGSIDGETSLGPICCTTGTNPADALPESCMQIFSIKVTDLNNDLSLPLEVHGFVAARDSVDRKRNYLFRCTRDNCQTLTPKDPFLHLTGPSRAVLLIDLVAIEVQLKVKGKKESEDEVLAFKCFYFHERYHLEDGIRFRIPSKRCMLEFALAVLPMSVEAIVGIRVVDGSWPDHCPGLVVCSTNSVKEGKVVLLDFQNGELPTKSDGVVELARRVVSVDYPEGKLTVSVEASRGRFSARGTVDFGMKVPRGSAARTCDLVFCKMLVTVAWSLVSCYRV